ncbi:MAG: YkvA family protein [Hyphomicrobiales bacterium]
MPWYGWLILGVGVVIALSAIAFRLLRASRRGRRFMALSMRGKLDFGRALLEDPEVPIAARIALILLVGYLALPLDLIPDFIPVIGQLDDGLVVVVAVGLLMIAVPREQFDRALRLAEESQEARRLARARPVG